MSEYISAVVRRRIRVTARNRCGYCLLSQDLLAWALEIEHILPLACGGTHDEANLWLSCRACNGSKGVQTEALDPVSHQRVALFNPRRQRWTRHFAWSADGGHIMGRTACGRATVLALNMNDELAVSVRRKWASVLAGIRRKRTPRRQEVAHRCRWNHDLAVEGRRMWLAPAGICPGTGE